MSEKKKAKKYYWLKLRTDYFRDRRIKLLRSMAGGDTYTIIFLKLQLEAVRNEGVLVYEGVCDTFGKEMALVIDEPERDVEITIRLLEEMNLLEPCEDGSFILPSVVENIGSETDAAERMRRLRAKQSAEAFPKIEGA